MNNLKLLPVLLIFLGVALRLVPHPANFAPITALALFGGVYLPKKYAFVLPWLVLLLSDIFLGFYGATMWFVYGSFFLSGLIGLYVKNHKYISSITGGTVLASVLFFIITNFGVWLSTNMYSKDFNGLIDCYVAAIPFFRNTLMGDLFFTGLFIGGYEVIARFSKNYLPKSL